MSCVLLSLDIKKAYLVKVVDFVCVVVVVVAVVLELEAAVERISNAILYSLS